jgi:glycosyltransferase involved in cell wall biosynthesis
MKRIAIVHDALCVPGGAERLVLQMAKAFPGAPIFTSVYLPDQTFAEFKELDVRTLPFSKFVKSERQFKVLLPLWLMELRTKSFKDFDYILSSSTYLAKYIKPAKNVRHRAYIHAPFRLLWKTSSYTHESLPTPRLLSPFIKSSLPVLRKWDQELTHRIPQVATSCKNVADEIQRIYNINAKVIYPPVKIHQEVSHECAKGDYFLSVSRLISHKRVDLAIEACNRLNRKLVIVGDGPERAILEKQAGPLVQFLGRVDDENLSDLYQNALALIFPSHEDFGIVPLEAQAWGVPVIAYGKGGALETIKEGISGIFFPDQTVESLIQSIIRFDRLVFNRSQIIEWVSKFDEDEFISRIREFVFS